MKSFWLRWGGGGGAGLGKPECEQLSALLSAPTVVSAVDTSFPVDGTFFLKVRRIVLFVKQTDLTR